MVSLQIFGFVSILSFAIMYVGINATRDARTARGRDTVKKRLVVDEIAPAAGPVQQNGHKENDLHNKAADRAKAFYEMSDPDNIARLRRSLMQAAIFNPDAVGRFLVARFVTLAIGLVLGLLYIAFTDAALVTAKGAMTLVAFALAGYFSPNVWLHQRKKNCNQEYRFGFPDFMDLMIVCANAGLSIDASIERVSREIADTHRNLSENLVLLSLELRAGRHLAEAMASLADRLGVEEVRGFATLLTQSRELGTSLSDTLRVFSEEMRDKRVMKAEEKAHALPAKMTVPVVVCILPVTVMVAIIPAIVRWQMQ